MNLQGIDAPRLFLLLVLAACAAALASAYAAQYLFGLQPCILCLYQRIPYAVAGALAMVGLLLAGRLPIPLILALCGLAFLGGAGLAGFHAGVEQHWWKGTAECTGDIPLDLSVAELKARLMATPLKRCDEVTWAVFGLSITVYNLLASLGLAVFCLAGARRLTRGARG